MAVKRMKPLPRKDVRRRVINLGSFLLRKGASPKQAAQIVFERYGPHTGARSAFDVERNYFWRGPKLTKFKGLSREEIIRLRRTLHARDATSGAKNAMDILGGEVAEHSSKEMSAAERKKNNPLVKRQKEIARIKKKLTEVQMHMDKEPFSLFTSAVNAMYGIWKPSQMEKFLTAHTIKQIQKMLRIEMNRLPKNERNVVLGKYVYDMNDREIANNYAINWGSIPALRKNALINIALRVMRQSPAFDSTEKK